MKLYFASIFTSSFGRHSTAYRLLNDKEREARDAVVNHLESYHYVKGQRYVDDIRRDGVKVFLDSGAFSAFTKGEQTDISAYCDYIHRNSDIIDVASVLDDIGDPEGTWRNQQEMESRGVQPLPCFHYGEPEEFLKHYMAKYDYITLGGMVPISTPQLILWLDRIWDRYLTDSEGRPKIKVHGFGLTSLSLMKRYPWYSVDSSSWTQIANNGNIIIPNVGTIGISVKSPTRKIEGQHLDNYSKDHKHAVESLLRSQGADPDRLRHEYISRWAYNIWSFMQVEREVNASKIQQFETPQPVLFS